MVETASKKRKASKKTKKSWRKNIDTKDVDRFLDDERLEERLGTPFSGRSDAELFTIDREPGTQAANLTTKQQRRLALKNKEPKCFAILKPHTAVPDPIAKRNRVKTPEERKNPITKRIEEARKLSGQQKLKEIIAKKNRVFSQRNRAARPKKGEFNRDIWEEETILQPELQNEWLTSDTIRHTLANTGRKRKRLPLTLSKKTSILAAVEPPHPGISYNPSYIDHQVLLAEVAQKEMKLMKEEAHLNRVTTKMFQKVSADKRDQNWMNEMSQGLPKKTEHEKPESDADDNVDAMVKSVNPPVKNIKKPLVKKRKQEEQKQLQRQRAKAKIEKKKIADIYKLRSLQKQLNTREQKELVLREKRLKVKERKAIEPKTLSRVKFEAPEPDFKLGEELAGNLRNSKPVGNLLRDRYKSLQQRNILAPGTRVLKRSKAKMKKFEKADHKMGWEGTFK